MSHKKSSHSSHHKTHKRSDRSDKSSKSRKSTLHKPPTKVKTTTSPIKPIKKNEKFDATVLKGTKRPWKNNRKKRNPNSYPGKGCKKFTIEQIEKILKVHNGPKKVTPKQMAEFFTKEFKQKISAYTIRQILKDPKKYTEGYKKPRNEYKRRQHKTI